MNIPSFSKGEVLTASKLNELAQAVKAIDEKSTSALITDVEGGEFSRSSFGTVLTIPQITPGGGREDDPWGDDEAQAHPFQVKLSVDESGNVSLRMKGGRWHGNGYGNYLGISYLEDPAEELKEPPKSVQPGEDLFFIPDCGTQGGIGDGETFAVCLYAPGSVAGRVKAYPWAYLKKISSLKAFREELLEYAFSAVAIVGVWTLDTKDGVKYLKGAPGQMLFGDFYYKSNQIFSAGKFGWSRIEGIPYGFRVEPGLIHVNPNNFKWGLGESKVGKIAPKDGETTGLSVKIPKLSLKTEVNSEQRFLKSVSSEEHSETGETTVEVEVPYYQITRATGSVSAGYTLSGSTETATAQATSEYVQTIVVTKEQLSAAPPNAADWTRTLVTGVAETSSRPSISYEKNKYTLKSSGTQTVVTDVSVSQSGTKTVPAKLPFKYMKYTGSEECLAENLKSVELSENGSVEYTVEGDLQGGLFEVKEGNEADAAKLGIAANGSTEPLEGFSDFWVTAPGTSFKLEKSDVEAGVIVAIRLGIEKGVPTTKWELIRNADLTASVKSVEREEAETETLKAAKTILGAGCTHQLVRLTIEQRFETETDTVDGITRTGAVFGVKAEMDTATAGRYEAVFPVGMIFFDRETAAPTVQSLCPGVIEYTPPLAIILNAGEESEHASEFEAPPGLSGEPKTYADKQLSAQAAFTASAHGLETADLNEVWEILEG